MIVIICAMQEEFNEVVKLMDEPIFSELSYFKIAKGSIENKSCTLALCGVGKVHAAICTQSLIMKFNPSLILNVGVAGAIDPELKISDGVIAEALIQHDFDISAFPNRKKGEISGIGSVEIKTTPWVREKLLKCSEEIPESKFYSGVILTGDQFINSKEKISSLKKEFGGLACEMEAGSIAQTCFLAKVPFGIIRTISDSADNSSHVDFYSFLKKSSENAAKLLKAFIKSLGD